MPSFITAAQFLTRYDYRWVGQNITDTGTPATESGVLASPVLAALIADASDDVMAAAAVGDRYSVDDLATYGGNLLVRIVADLTMGLILKRRARAVKDEKDLSGPYTEAMDKLEALRRGERIFYAVPGVPEAGLPGTASMLPIPGINPPNWTQQANRYFGSSGWPQGPGNGWG